MKPSSLLISACLFSFAFSAASPERVLAQTATAPPVAGAVPLSTTVTETEAIVHGWSVKNRLLGKVVRNDKKENLGTIDDIIITPKDFASFAVIGVGGFLGIDQRQVAIPMRRLKWINDRFELPGATKDVLKEMPPFVYAH